jgi:hypothetical protein
MLFLARTLCTDMRLLFSVSEMLCVPVERKKKREKQMEYKVFRD